MLYINKINKFTKLKYFNFEMLSKFWKYILKISVPLWFNAILLYIRFIYHNNTWYIKAYCKLFNNKTNKYKALQNSCH